MAYTPTTWVNGSGGGTPLSATNLNHLEAGVDDIDARMVLSVEVAPATTLPGSPVNLQKAILVDSTTAPTYAWLFQYSTTISDSNKWLCIGGSPAITSAINGTSASGSGVWSDVGDIFTFPRAGVYYVTLYGEPQGTGSGTTSELSVGINTQTVTFKANNVTTISGAATATVTAAASDVLDAYVNDADSTRRITFNDIHCTIVPRRVA